MATPAGRWVEILLPAGGIRQDWVPAAQPPAPDAGAGLWHVVVSPFPGGDSRWEWHPTPVRAASAPVQPKWNRSVGTQVWRGIGIAVVLVLIVGALAGIFASNTNRGSDHDNHGVLVEWWAGLTTDDQRAICDSYSGDRYATVSGLATAAGLGRGHSTPTDPNDIDEFLSASC